MDHNEAVRLQATEKYVLGELSEELRDDFEEHFFDCAECAEDMKAAAVFVDTTRDVLRKDFQKAAEREAVPARVEWLSWLRPVIAVPAFAVLLLALAYQNFVTVPHWKNAAMQASAPRVLLPISLIAANTRGSESPTVRVRPDEQFGFYVDVPSDPAYNMYELRLQDPTGDSRVLRTLSYAEAQKPVVVDVPNAARAGAYEILVLGTSGQQGKPGKNATLASMKFTVEHIE
jgi:Putative zinc-finger